MRAPYRSATPVFGVTGVTFLYFLATLVASQDSEGYTVEDPDAALDAIDNEEVCPTDRLLRTRELCQVDGVDVQCIKYRCCNTHIYVSGRCIPKSVDPCSLQLCEQACEVRANKLWCTCHPGYKFHEHNYRNKKQPYCVDIDECATNNGGCDQRCINDPGGFHCECRPPSIVGRDGKSCVIVPIPINMPPEPLSLTRAASRCYASCDSVSLLTRKMKEMNEKMKALQETLNHIKEEDDRFAEGTYTYRLLDSTAKLEGDYCRCERGPRGPPGAPGMEGPKGVVGARGPRGARGPKGSMDMMLLLVADLKHDIRNLEAKVYKDGEVPERFNLHKAWRRQRKQEKMNQASIEGQELEAYTSAPSVVGIDDLVEITPNGVTGTISHIQTTASSETPRSLTQDLEEQLRRLHMLANITTTDDDDDDGEQNYDYTFY